MRYLWDLSEDYFKRLPKLIVSVINVYFKWLKKWDRATSEKVDIFIANSKNIAQKISQFYGKQATVIYPPMDIPKETINLVSVNEGGNFFLIVSALVPYKRIDIAVEAFNSLRMPLRIVGDGPLLKELKKRARYEGIEFEGWLKQDVLWDRYRHTRALIFPGEEDCGIAPMEAQAFGKPVIAYGKGGVTETVLAANGTAASRSSGESTGIFFYEQRPEALVEAVMSFTRLRFDPEFIQTHACQFAKKHFEIKFKHLLESCIITT